MDLEAFSAELKETLANRPRVPGVAWPMALSVCIMRAIDEEQPGFTDKVRAIVLRSAASMEASGDPDEVADAPSMRELAESWVFMPKAAEG